MNLKAIFSGVRANRVFGMFVRTKAKSIEINKYKTLCPIMTNVLPNSLSKLTIFQGFFPTDLVLNVTSMIPTLFSSRSWHVYDFFHDILFTLYAIIILYNILYVFNLLLIHCLRYLINNRIQRIAPGTFEDLKALRSL